MWKHTRAVGESIYVYYVRIVRTNESIHVRLYNREYLSEYNREYTREYIREYVVESTTVSSIEQRD